MAKVAWTAKAIAGLPRGRKADHGVAGRKGLQVRVNAAGELLWAYRGRIAGTGKVHTRVKGLIALAPSGLPRQSDMDAAEAWARERNRLCREGQDPGAVERAAEAKAAAENITVGDLWDLYSQAFTTAKGKGLRPGTIEDYRRRWRLAVAPTFAARRAADITVPDLLAWHDELEQRNEGTYRSADKDWAVLSAVLQRGVKRGLLPFNPCKGNYPAVKQDPVDKPMATPEQLAEITGRSYALAYHKGLMVDVMSTTGMRVSEVAEMMWERFTPDAHGGADYLIPATGAKGRKERAVYLAPDTWGRLQEWRNASGVAQAAGWVFPSARSASGRVKSMRWVGEIAKDMGLEGFTNHGIRAYFATRCYEDGMSPVDIQAIMGHADLQTTMRYVRQSDARRKAKDAALARAAENRSAAGANAATVVPFPSGVEA